MAAPQPEIKKDIIYIDIDDEITTIIEKLQSSTQRIVALVLPKRATVLQSIVNMKLLKRAAENNKKHIVLITSEAGLLPLAGAVGMHVARTLQSKPAIPVAPDMMDREQIIDGETGEDAEDFDPDAVADQPVGKLAAAGGAAGQAGLAGGAAGFDDPETIELDNADPAPSKLAGAGASAAAGAAAVKKGKDKKLKIPDFNKFRLFLILGIVLLLGMIGGGVYAASALPHADITIKTDSSDIATDAKLTLDPKATEMDQDMTVLPAKLATKQQTGTQQVSTSGQKNNGTRASGAVTLTLNNCDVDSVTIPAGTGVSAGGQTFITQSGATLESIEVGGKCRNADFKDVSTEEVSVIAQKAGVAFNIAASSFAVAGFAAVTGQSDSPMTGGTDDIVKIVTQADIDSAKQKISSQDADGIEAELTTKLKTEGFLAIPGSLHTGTPTVTPSAAVGDQADTVTVNQTTIYTLYGAKEADLKNVITTNVRKEIDPTKQQILKDGLKEAKYTIPQTLASGPLRVDLTASSLAGPDIDVDKLKQQLAGKKTGEVKQTIRSVPGVTDVVVTYGPFWVSEVPAKADKVNITIEKSNQ